MSQKLTLDKGDVKKIAHAFLWSLVSAIFAGLVAILASPDIQFPAWLVPLVPAINVFLYGAWTWWKDNG